MRPSIIKIHIVLNKILRVVPFWIIRIAVHLYIHKELLNKIHSQKINKEIPTKKTHKVIKYKNPFFYLIRQSIKRINSQLILNI
jgi:hypothetical protein